MRYKEQTNAANKAGKKPSQCSQLSQTVQFNNSSSARSTTPRQIRYCSPACANLLWFFCSLVLLSLTTFLINLPRKSNQQGAIIERVNQTTINNFPNFFCASLQRLHSLLWKIMEVLNIYVNSKCSSFFLLFLANRLKDRTGSQLSNGNKFSRSVKVIFFLPQRWLHTLNSADSSWFLPKQNKLLSTEHHQYGVPAPPQIQLLEFSRWYGSTVISGWCK